FKSSGDDFGLHPHAEDSLEPTAGGGDFLGARRLDFARLALCVDGIATASCGTDARIVLSGCRTAAAPWLRRLSSSRARSEPPRAEEVSSAGLSKASPRKRCATTLPVGRSWLPFGSRCSCRYWRVDL